MSPAAARRSDRPGDELLDELFDEIAAKVQAGEPIAWKDYAGDSERAERIRRLLPAVEALVRLGRGAPDHPAEELQGEMPLSGMLGEFRIKRQIGRGGMGVVYEAEQTSLGRRVALKILPFAAVLDPRRLQRFKNEALAAAALDHPNVVRVHSFGCEQGVHYYAMQYIDGLTLAQVIDDLRAAPAAKDRVRKLLAKTSVPATAAPLALQPSGDAVNDREPPDETPGQPPPSETVGSRREGAPSPSDWARSKEFFRAVACLGVQAAGALAHAHQMGVVHRDIKPSNLMVDAEGNLWVTDFGLAMVETDFDLTLTGDAVGTLPYMSPEQAQGNGGVVDHRTDIYSLGITLYEVLTLQSAFPAERREALLRQVLEGEPRPPRQVNRAIPKDLETIVQKAIAKEASARYATAEEFADDLRRFLNDEPIHARRPSLGQRAAKWSRRHRALVWSALALLLTTAVGLAGATAMLWKARQQTESARNDAEQALAEARRSEEDANAATTFLTDVLGAVAPEKARGRKVTVEEVLAGAEKKIEQAFAGQPLIEARVRWEIAEMRMRLGQYADAQRQLLRVRDLYAEQLGPEHRKTLLARNSLANVLASEGKWSEAQKLIEEVLPAQVRTLGADHAETAMSRNTLGSILGQQGKYDGARQVFEEALATFRRVYGEPGRSGPEADHHTFAAMANLAHARKCLGQLGEADSLYKELLAAQRRVLGGDHPDTLNTMSNYADLLRDQGRLEEAGKLYDEALAADTRVLGANHPQTLITMVNQGMLLRRQWKLAEARALHQRTLAAYRQALGDDHPSTIGCMVVLARDMELQGDLEGAGKLEEEALERCRRVLGPDHRTTLAVAGSLANTLRYQGKLAQARRLIAETLAADRRVLGAEHPDTIASLDNLAWVNLALGKFADAEKLFEETLAVARRALSSGHPLMMDAVHGLAEALLSQGKLDEACLLYEERLAACRRLLGEGHPAIITTAEQAARVLSGVPAASEQIRKRAVELARRATELAPADGNCQRTLGVALYRSGDCKGAVAALEKSVQLRSGGEASDFFFLAMANRKLGHNDEARTQYDKGVQWMEKTASKDEELLRCRDEAAGLLGIEPKVDRSRRP